MKKIIHLLRVKHWTKNLFCFAGLIFNGEIFNLSLWVLSFEVFLSFCFSSSAIYIMNDIYDRSADALHPRKKNRPIANGSISISLAITIGLISISIGLYISWIISKIAFVIILIYIFNNLIYSIWLKKLLFLDVFSISIGFILRMASGVYVLGEIPTSWIILCTMFLSLFLGFSKRLSELKSIKNKSEYNQRVVLIKYNEKSLINLVNETSFGSVFSYALFSTISGKNPALVITIPIVYYAINYYKMSLLKGEFGEEPESVILADRTLWVCILFWLVTVVIIIIFDFQFIN